MDANPFELRVVRSAEELEHAFRLRFRVFCEEQNVAESLERDEHDRDAVHLVALDRAGDVVGTARIVRYEPAGAVAKVGRVAVSATLRKTGLGRRLMEAVHEEARRRGFTQIVLDAQVPVRGFYERLGYAAEGPEFMDAGIPHVRMRFALRDASRVS